MRGIAPPLPREVDERGYPRTVHTKHWRVDYSVFGTPVATMFTDGPDAESAVRRGLEFCREARELPFVEFYVTGGAAGEYETRNGEVYSNEGGLRVQMAE